MTESRMLDASRRPLTETQSRLIRAKIRSLTTRGRRASAISIPITAGFVLILWLWTILASNAPWLVVTAFWISVGGGIALWVRRDMRTHAGHLEGMARSLESALRRDAADVYDVRAKAFAEFEEIEDEGACYAFELDDNRLVFVTGQQFYDSARFPSLDFSLVYVRDEAGQTVDMLIDKRGAKAIAAKKIPAATKQKLDMPDHLEVRIGTIDDLETVLGPSA
jgi:hypothetical protein